MYKATNSTSITRTADGASIPADPANTDYAQYLQWLSAGNTPEPADPAPIEPVADQITRLEREQLLPRATREFMLAYLETTYTAEQREANIGYKKLKAFDESIKGLRSKL